MKLYTHIVEQPFVFATGLAALVHSTWSLGTLFSGKQPEAGLSIEFAGWIIPAFLIAFAMDVGQIVTSAEIRAGNRSKAKYATFAVFAISTFYLQWLYMAHHMPALELAGGVRDQWSGFATFVRDAAVWIIPAFLPLSTLMYTFSSDHAQPETSPESITVPEIVAVQVSTPVMEALPAPVMEVKEENEELAIDIPLTVYTATCNACGWEKQYKTSDAMRRGLATHMSLHCTAIHPEKSPVLTSTNGNGHGGHHE